LGLLVAGALLLPALVVWDLAILPVGAQTVVALKVAGVMLAAVWLAAFLCLRMLMNGTICAAALASVLAVSGLAFEMGRQNVIQSTAISDKVAWAKMEAEARFAKLKFDQEALYPSNVPLGPNAGPAIYKEHCSSCHSWEHKVVGPAHKDVVPKYRGNREGLVAFILNPKKVDPAYPAMMPPGLSHREAVAVADYLLNHLETDRKGGPAK
jgi:cytochrome c551/c552